ncbi:MAG: phosphodiester glycosidase family protein [Xenococcaceae cyanobacterium]
MSFNAGNILNDIEKYLDCYISYNENDKPITEDVLPITIAIANPEQIAIGVSIQQNYPLGMIHREYGIPYAKIKGAPTTWIYDTDQLHRMKMQLEVHEAVFEIDAINDLVLQEPKKKGLVIAAFSTGMGNTLQNRECIAFVNYQKGSKILHHVDGQKFDDHPFPCLVAYSEENEKDNTKKKIGVELLLFTSSGYRCDKIDRKQFFSGQSAMALKEAEENFQDKILWAVSGYPLIMDSVKVPMEYISQYVSDYRHLWKLPKLDKSLSQRIKNLSDSPYKKKIEFFYGFYRFRNDSLLRLKAAHNETIKMPLHPEIASEWFTRMCNMCQISEEELKEPPPDKLPEEEKQKKWVFAPDSNQIFWDAEDLTADFEKEGYQRVDSEALVKEKGQFYIDEDNKFITLKLNPGVYPHHIVGLTDETPSRLVNISIGGRGGRSGITIKKAQEFCQKIGLRDAIIFDNGNDVISRITKGPVIRHKDNTRQTRLTAALHFGYVVDSMLSGSDFEGLEFAYKTLKVETKTKHPKAMQVESSPNIPQSKLPATQSTKSVKI